MNQTAKSPQGHDVATSQDGDSRSRNRSLAANDRRSTSVVPPVDIFEDESGFTVIADIPGVSKDRLDVRVDGDNLVIEGAASAPVTGPMDLMYGEVLNPLYRRSFMLSRELDTTKIQAQLVNGVLKLNIPKAEAARPRRIEVAVA